jgi:hypothetical protein
MKITCMELVKDYIIQETEKAYGLDNGYNSKITVYGSMQDNIKWIPKSLVQNIDNKLYVSYITIQNNGLWDWVNKNSKITLDNGKKRASGNELVLKRLNAELKDNNNLTLIVWDNKQFNSYSIDRFESYKQEGSKFNKEFNNFEDNGMVAVLKIENNQIVESLIQNQNILNAKQIELLNLVIETLA